MRRAALLVAILLCVLAAFPASVQSAPLARIKVKELNFVFLHGMGGNCCAFQLLSDSLAEHLPAFMPGFEQANPGTTLRINSMTRCYPGYADIDTWAYRIVDDINVYFKDKEDLILVGHSMGGKTALHAVAQNLGGLADRVVAVVTINSPIRSLDRYHPPGGGPVLEYLETILLGSDEGVVASVTYLDSAEEGARVSRSKNWLAFISAEKAPLSPQFNRAGVDIWPRDMDDGVVPLSAQHSDGADVVYYGEHGHSDFGAQEAVASLLADRILRYVLGETVDCAVLARGGGLDHRADWLLGTDHWDEVVGDVITSSGVVWHRNESWTEWQEWEDVVSENLPGSKRSRIEATLASLPLLTGIAELRWLNPDDVSDCRLYVRTRAAPRNTVRVRWAVHIRGLLPQGVRRSHYEVEITASTPLATVPDASWVNLDSGDIRLRLRSEAQSPFRWFRADWRTYYTEGRQRNIISRIPVKLVWPDD